MLQQDAAHKFLPGKRAERVFVGIGARIVGQVIGGEIKAALSGTKAGQLASAAGPVAPKRFRKRDAEALGKREIFTVRNYVVGDKGVFYGIGGKKPSFSDPCGHFSVDREGVSGAEDALPAGPRVGPYGFSREIQDDIPRLLAESEEFGGKSATHLTNAPDMRNVKLSHIFLL